MSDWISVEDRLPDEGKEVLFHWRNSDGKSDIEITSLMPGESITDWAFIPTHWMPLPEPPEGE